MVQRGWGMPAWHFFLALLVFWLAILKLINFSFPLFPSFCLDFSDFLSPKVIREVSVVERVVLCDLNDLFDELSFSDVPLKYHIPSKLLQKAAALFSALALGNSTTIADVVVNGFQLTWDWIEGMCLVGFIEGVANKRYVGLPTSLHQQKKLNFGNSRVLQSSPEFPKFNYFLLMRVLSFWVYSQQTI